MTNLDIIKYLATNNPTRLAELLDDIYCDAYNDGYNDDWGANPHFKKWLFEEVSVVDALYSDGELEEWSKAINPTPSLEVFYGSKSKVIDQTIDEIKLLETITESEKYSSEVYDRFRKEVCAKCADANCLRSQAEIYDCYKF